MIIVKKNNKPSQAGRAVRRASSDLWGRPGYLVRRLHQIHIGLFAEECGAFDITPVQFAILTILNSGKALDQYTLSTAVGIDRTSGADVIKRLERRGLVIRRTSPDDKRAKLVNITDEGAALEKKMLPSVRRAQKRFMAPLSAEETDIFNQLIRRLIEVNDAASRAPIVRNL